MFLYAAILILVYCISQTYVSTSLSLLFLIITIILCQFIFLYIRDQQRVTVKHLSIDSIYHNLQHGDIIFSSCVSQTLPLEHFFMVMNQGTSHMGIIIEEEGVKYFVHAYAGDNDKYTHQADYVIPFLKQIPFKVLKEPLLTMILTSLPLYYQVYRTNCKTLCLPKDYVLSPYLLRYCTISIAPLLVKAGIIPKDTTLLIPYRPEYIIHHLQLKKYPCFYMIDSRKYD